MNEPMTPLVVISALGVAFLFFLMLGVFWVGGTLAAILEELQKGRRRAKKQIKKAGKGAAE